MGKKVVKFSFTKQKTFWVLVFSFMYLVSVDPMDRSLLTNSRSIRKKQIKDAKLTDFCTVMITQSSVR